MPASLLEHEHDLWTTRVDQTAAKVDTERDRLLRATIHRTDPGTHLKDSVSLRHDTLLSDALSQQPDWVLTLLGQLNARGPLEQLPGRAVAEVIGNVAAYRDRWSIRTPEPLGPAPGAAAIEKRAEWQKLRNQLQPGHLVATPRGLLHR